MYVPAERRLRLSSIHCFKMETIIGLSAYYHDSAAALLIDGRLVAAAQEERFTRKKHDASFPRYALRFVMEEAGLRGKDVSLVAFYEKPFIKFERLLETSHVFAPQGFRRFLQFVPVWLKEKLYMKRMIHEELRAVGVEVPLLFPDHHLSHAASAFYPSPFDQAAILTVDGVGEWATTTIGRGAGKEITLLREIRFPHSLGLFYAAFTAYCGFRVNSGEYKLMGLASYGGDTDRTRRYIDRIRQHLIDLRSDGSFLLNMDYFAYATDCRMTRDTAWERLFGIPPRLPEQPVTQAHIDLAYAAQAVTEEAVVRLARTARRMTGCRDLVMAGGVALNCVANGRIEREGIFERLWIQPAAGDAGGALGAAYAARHIYLNEPRLYQQPDALAYGYLGPSFSDARIVALIRKTGASAQYLPDGALEREAAARLAEGRIVGWFQGAMEWGPRALGNRSILADPRRAEMKERLNRAVKFREEFRPFAPSVLEEEASRYFEGRELSPYMLKVATVVPAYRTILPAVTHVDGTARVQTVSCRSNPLFHSLLEAFREQTGYGVLVNTSFNVRGEPIVCTPEEGYRCFMRSGLDFLALGKWWFDKREQPPLAEAPHVFEGTD